MNKQEKESIKKISKPLKCMHNIKYLIERENHWKCTKCGFISKKRMPSKIC
jgi:rubrerythrin